MSTLLSIHDINIILFNISPLGHCKIPSLDIKIGALWDELLVNHEARALELVGGLKAIKKINQLRHTFKTPFIFHPSPSLLTVFLPPLIIV